MGKINWGRVFLGGLLAGAVANVLGFSTWYLFLGSRWRAGVEVLGRTLQETTGYLAFWIILYFVQGILAVWLYAAVRPRFGPGPKTAACTGFAFWLLAGLIPALAWGSLGLFPTGLVAVDAGTYLVVIVVATVIGAWPYKE